MPIVFDQSLTLPAKELGIKIQALIFANPGVEFTMRRGGEDNDRIIIEA